MMKIPFSPPDITQNEIDAVVEVLKSGWITTGPKTRLLEKTLCEYCNCDKTVCLSSATAALELTLRVLGIGAGDEVITTAYTYTASASVIVHTGATPVLVDTQEDSFEMDYDKLAGAITDKTKAIIPVDIAGIVCDYDKIFEIVESKRSLFTPCGEIQSALGRIAVISDAAHALGAERKGKKCGEIADFTCFSFHAVKNITTAEGGAVTFNKINGVDENELYKKYQLLSLHGQDKDAIEKSRAGVWEYDIVAPYYKCNMTDVAAAMGLSQLERYESMLSRRHDIVKKYNELSREIGATAPAHQGEDFSSSAHLYMMRLKGLSEQKRNEFIAAMSDEGVCVNVHYKPLPMHTAYKNLGFDIKDFPNARALYENEVTLPLYPQLTDEQVEYVIAAVKKCLAQIG